MKRYQKLSAKGSKGRRNMTVRQTSDDLEAFSNGHKRVAPQDLLQAIRVVASGNVYLDPAVAKDLVSDYLIQVQAGSERESFEVLTDRERQVLTLIAEDATNQAVANELDISVKTVERHRENIMRKLNLHTRTELVKYAIRKGLISLDDG